MGFVSPLKRAFFTVSLIKECISKSSTVSLITPDSVLGALFKQWRREGQAQVLFDGYPVSKKKANSAFWGAYSAFRYIFQVGKSVRYRDHIDGLPRPGPYPGLDSAQHPQGWVNNLFILRRFWETAFGDTSPRN